MTSIAADFDKRYVLRWLAVLASYWYLQATAHIEAITYVGEVASNLGNEYVAWARWIDFAMLLFAGVTSLILGVLACWLLPRGRSADLVVVVAALFWIIGAFVAADGHPTRTLGWLLLLNAVSTLLLC